MKKGTVLLYGKQSFSISQQKGAEIVAATNQTEKMAHSREMDLAVFTDWFPDGGAFGAAFDFVQLYFPPCVFYTVTHFYCPGCGNTRTVLALLHGHPLQALHNNAAFCYLLVVLLLLYLQKVLRCFGKPVQLLPKGNWFPIVSVCICMAYCLIRNFIPWMQPLPV